MSFQNNIPPSFPQTPIKKHVANFRDNPVLDFSSGGEMQSSPENADNEDTPDMKGLNDNVTVFRGNHSPNKGLLSPTKQPSRNSISSYFSRFSPSHKSIVRKDQIARQTSRGHKRKRGPYDKDIKTKYGNELYKDSRSSNSESEYDSEAPAQYSSPRKGGGQSKLPPAEIGTIPAILKFIDEHPGLPHTIAWWLQMIMSFLIVGALSYICYSFYSAIRRDVNLKAEELSQGVLKEIGICTENFLAHDCSRRERLGSSFKRLCDEWEVCMNRDHLKIGLALVSASTWAEILNGFVDPLSGKIIVS
jgi:hypothetical protein